MPVLAFLSLAGFALIALLFVADATLEKRSPPIVTSNRIGLPEQRHADTVQVLVTTPAPAPDMTSQAVLSAQPKSKPEGLEKIEPAARAQVPPDNSRVMRPIDYRQNRWDDKLSIGGQ